MPPSIELWRPDPRVAVIHATNPAGAHDPAAASEGPERSSHPTQRNGAATPKNTAARSVSGTVKYIPAAVRGKRSKPILRARRFPSKLARQAPPRTATTTTAVRIHEASTTLVSVAIIDAPA